MSKTAEKIKYEEWNLDPKKAVGVKSQDYILRSKVITDAIESGTKVWREAVFSWYNKDTHEKLSAKSKSKLSDADLTKRYYNTLDQKATESNIRYLIDDNAWNAILADSTGVGTFRDNIDSGNRIPREDAKK
jgi:hypothetical protein